MAVLQTTVTEQKPAKRLTRGQLIWRRFLRNRTAVVGAVGILFLVFLALAGPYLFYWKFDDIDSYNYLTEIGRAHV